MIDSLRPNIAVIYMFVLVQLCQLGKEIFCVIIGILIIQSYTSDYNILHNINLNLEVSNNTAPGIYVDDQDDHTTLYASLEAMSGFLFSWLYHSLWNLILYFLFGIVALSLWTIYRMHGCKRPCRIIIRDFVSFTAFTFFATSILAMVACVVPDDNALKFYVGVHHGEWLIEGLEQNWLVVFGR